MSEKISQKINFSSINVLKTLQVLIGGDYSMYEIINILNEKEPYEKFNNSVVSKYINTCRFVGIDIIKINNKYNIIHLPFGLELSIPDIDALKTLQLVVNKHMTSKNSPIYDKFICKLNRYSQRHIARVTKDSYNLSFEVFERAVALKRKINLLFLNQTQLECIPLKITEINGKTFFCVFNKRMRMIDVKRLVGVELTENKFVEPYDGDMVTIYTLKGNLAKRYEARENESVQMNNDGSITITNRNENKEALFSRLIRYQDLCEINYPKIYREDFKKFLSDTLKNYGIN